MKTDIAVIGAGGAAGGMLMHDLKKYGANAIGFEALARQGGRIWTTWKKNVPFPIELGAEFVHSEWLRDFVHSFGLTTVRHPSDGLAYAENRFHPLLPVLELVRDLREETKERLRDEGEMSVEEFLSNHPRLRQMEEQMGITRHLVEQLIRNDHSARVSELSVSGWLEPDTDGLGENYRIKEGFSELLTRLTEGCDIRYRHPVTEIRWTPSDVEIYTKKGTFNARRAVIALPIGILQERKIKFTPDLPIEKWRAIDQIQAGMASKIVTSFSRSRAGNIFWPKGIPQVATSLSSQLSWPTGWGYPESQVGQFYVSTLVGGAATERFEEDPRNTALMQLRHMFGRRVLDQALKTHFSVHWHKEKTIRTGYSWTSSAHGPAIRREYGQSIDDTIFFMGEAVGDPDVSGAVASVSGAIRSAMAVEKQLRTA